MIDRSKLIQVGFQLLLGLAVLSCGGQNGRQKLSDNPMEGMSQSATGQAVILFDTLIHDFGTIIEGEQVVCYFDYRNTGGEDLLISSVEATCGCTTPDWSREPLRPGEKASLAIIFDASGRSGIQRKSVTVRSNASKQEIRLSLRANVNTNV